MALGGLIWEAWGGSGWTAALLAAVGFWMRLMLTGALGFPFFLLRMTGAGDVKLMAVIAAEGPWQSEWGYVWGLFWPL